MALPCPICTTEQVQRWDDPGVPFAKIRCPRCGDYTLPGRPGDAFAEALAPHERATLSGLLREHADRSRDVAYPAVLTEAEARRLLASGNYPLTADQQVEKLLLAVAARAPFLGDATAPEPIGVWASRAFVPNGMHAEKLLGALGNGGPTSLGLLVVARDQGVATSITLTFEGLLRVEALRRSTAASNQAFVAMWFHDDLKSIYAEGILPAIRECGLSPYRVDQDRKNPDRVDMKIVAEIRRSRVVIADVTGERPGVYYEAGLAEGLGIPVVWCCNRSWRPRLPSSARPDGDHEVRTAIQPWPERMHFDTRQFPHLLWDDAAHLHALLRDTLIGRGIATGA